VNEQKQDGQTQTTKLVKGKPLPSLLVAPSVENQTLQSFMLTSRASEQIKFAKNVTKKIAINDGTQDHQLIGGHRVVTNMALPKNFWLRCMKSKKENVQSVVKYQTPKEDCTLTIATQPRLFVGFCATDVTLASAL